MKVCILIASEYPYGMGEPFLENEIEYLSGDFDYIYCFSVYGNKEAYKRSTPKNVFSFPLNEIRGKKKYIIDIASGLLKMNDIYTIKEKSLINIILCLYSRGIASSIAKKICKILDDTVIGERSCSNFTTYSYWFNYHAQASIQVKRYLANKGYDVLSVSRAHRYDIYWEENSANFLPFQYETLQNIDKVYSCSEDGAKYLRHLFPSYSNKIEIARLGTRDYGVKTYKVSDEMLCVTCSKLKPVKRVDLFAKAFVIAAKRYKKLRWICIGNGDQLDKIKGIIERNNISNNVDFLLDLTNEEVMKFYIRTPVTFFCNVSSSEGVPVSIMEAMSFGIPIIATNVGGTGEIVNDKVGQLIDPDIGEEQLSEILISEINLPEQEYINKRKAAREQWKKMSSAKRNYSEWVNVIKNYSG